jgi:hypothetical protein
MRWNADSRAKPRVFCADFRVSRAEGRVVREERGVVCAEFPEVRAGDRIFRAELPVVRAENGVHCGEKRVFRAENGIFRNSFLCKSLIFESFPTTFPSSSHACDTTDRFLALNAQNKMPKMSGA